MTLYSIGLIAVMVMAAVGTIVTLACAWKGATVYIKEIEDWRRERKKIEEQDRIILTGH